MLVFCGDAFTEPLTGRADVLWLMLVPLMSSLAAETALHYEFMQDYKVHIKHTDGRYEQIPYFCLPAKELNDVIAPSCYSCFDYPNALADLVVRGGGGRRTVRGRGAW